MSLQSPAPQKWPPQQRGTHKTLVTRVCTANIFSHSLFLKQTPAARALPGCLKKRRSKQNHPHRALVKRDSERERENGVGGDRKSEEEANDDRVHEISSGNHRFLSVRTLYYSSVLCARRPFCYFTRKAHATPRRRRNTAVALSMSTRRVCSCAGARRLAAVLFPALFAHASRSLPTSIDIVVCVRMRP